MVPLSASSFSRRNQFSERSVACAVFETREVCARTTDTKLCKLLLASPRSHKEGIMIVKFSNRYGGLETDVGCVAPNI